MSSRINFVPKMPEQTQGTTRMGWKIQKKVTDYERKRQLHTGHFRLEYHVSHRVSNFYPIIFSTRSAARNFIKTKVEELKAS